MTRYDAHANDSYRDQGMATVVITRTDDSGLLQAGVVLVDLFCLGVKNAFLLELPTSAWPEKLARLLPAEHRVTMHPACARKLIEGAIAYAEALGFLPHRDYRKARRAFGSVDTKQCPENFVYGKDGKPLYVAGPDDDRERVSRILRMLTAKVGREGFHYIVPAETLDQQEPERE